MSEEPLQSSQLWEEPVRTYVYIKTELEREGFEVQRVGIDGPVTTDRVIVTTDKEVLEEVKSRLREYGADKGITLKFEVAGQEN